MARPQSSPILSQLRNAKSFSEQSDSLQALKNEIVGHSQKKEAWLALGVLEPIVQTLSTNRPHGKSGIKDARPSQCQKPLLEEDRVRLQALQLIASFAHGGSAFLRPLHAAGALPAILTCISPTENASQIVVAALKALICIANASALALPSTPLDIPTLADNVFSPEHVESLCLMLATPSAKHRNQSQQLLASTLICRLCREERHQHALATSGVLDMLATQLASFAVSKGHVVPGAEEEAYRNQLLELFPDQAHPNAKLGRILEAISVIVGDSKYRSTRLVNSPAILAVFPSLKFHLSGDSVGAKGGRDKITAMEHLLPTVIPNRVASERKYSVPDDRGMPDKYAAWDMVIQEARDKNSPPAPALWDDPSYETQEIESPLIPWLILQARALSGYDRLMAVAVLTALYKAGLGRPTLREMSLGLLVVPLLLDLMTKAMFATWFEETSRWVILERAPAILAVLITDSDHLQEAAFDARGVKILTKVLRDAYEPVSNLEQPKAWSPHPVAQTNEEPSSLSASSQLGEPGQHPLIVHRVRVRESALRAIATLASGLDDYRKAFVDEAIVPYIVESLMEHPSKPRQIRNRTRDKTLTIEAACLADAALGYGTNPLSVIIAACHCVRMMSRSISILRTSLVDHAVALPIFEYMKHADVRVQIAATGAICNLVVEVSPVRELLVQRGVMKVLCEHAHSDDLALRMNSLWSLKHLVVAMSPEMKKACLEQLEPRWLVQLVNDEDAEALSSFNLRPRPSSTSDDADEEMEAAPSEEPFRWLYVANGILRELDTSRSTKLRRVEDTLAMIREAEVNPSKRLRNDNIAIQEQCLDFIRNLIGPGPGTTAELPSETAEMIEYLLERLGQERLFDVLESKLHAKVLNPYYQRGSSGPRGRETRVLYPQSKIIAAVIFILVHIAASTPHHRQMVMKETTLLKQLAQHANSKDKEVRVALCHLVINLTGSEDEPDGEGCGDRANELRLLGLDSKMKNMLQNDKDLDVRERAKTAVWQLQRSLAY